MIDQASNTTHSILGDPIHDYPVEFVVRAFPRNCPRHKTDHSEYIGKKVLDLPKAFATAVDREFDIEAVLAPPSRTSQSARVRTISEVSMSMDGPSSAAKA
jgi:hypothetical protein